MLLDMRRANVAERERARASTSPDVSAALTKSGLLPTLSDPAKFSELIRQDAVRKAEVIKRANLVIE